MKKVTFVKHSKMLQTMMEYCQFWWSTRHIAPPNEVEQTEVKTDYKKIKQ